MVRMHWVAEHSPGIAFSSCTMPIPAFIGICSANDPPAI